MELRLSAAGIKRSAADVMNDMQHLHSVLSIKKGHRTPERRLETPSKYQAEVLSVFGHYVDEDGVLQTLRVKPLLCKRLRQYLPFIPETPVSL